MKPARFCARPLPVELSPELSDELSGELSPIPAPARPALGLEVSGKLSGNVSLVPPKAWLEPALNVSGKVSGNVSPGQGSPDPGHPYARGISFHRLDQLHPAAFGNRGTHTRGEYRDSPIPPALAGVLGTRFQERYPAHSPSRGRSVGWAFRPPCCVSLLCAIAPMYPKQVHSGVAAGCHRFGDSVTAENPAVVPARLCAALVHLPVFQFGTRTTALVEPGRWFALHNVSLFRGMLPVLGSKGALYPNHKLWMGMLPRPGEQRFTVLVKALQDL